MKSFEIDFDDVTAIVDIAFLEDIGSGDLTTKSIVPSDSRIEAVMVARQDLVVSGIPIVEQMLNQADPTISLDVKFADGSEVCKGDAILKIEGVAEGILTAERSALNSLQFLSGIATLTHSYVSAIRDKKAVLLDTRKTIPGLRNLSKYAVRCGGAKNHRMRLDDGILIKDNHIVVAGSIARAVKLVKSRNSGKIGIQAECDTLEQVKHAMQAGADSLLLDNMSLAALRECVQIVAGRVPLEASGGVTLESIRAIADTGVDYISVGAITQRAPAVDIGLDVAWL